MCSIAQFGLAPGSLVGEWTAEDRLGTTLIEGKGRGGAGLVRYPGWRDLNRSAGTPVSGDRFILETGAPDLFEQQLTAG